MPSVGGLAVLVARRHCSATLTTPSEPALATDSSTGAVLVGVQNVFAPDNETVPVKSCMRGPVAPALL